MAKKQAAQVQVNDIDTALAAIETTSGKIRYLSSLGKTRSEISKMVMDKKGNPIRYQHVRNVLTQPLKKTAE